MFDMIIFCSVVGTADCIVWSTHLYLHCKKWYINKGDLNWWWPQAQPQFQATEPHFETAVQDSNIETNPLTGLPRWLVLSGSERFQYKPVVGFQIEGGLDRCLQHSMESSVWRQTDIQFLVKHGEAAAYQLPRNQNLKTQALKTWKGSRYENINHQDKLNYDTILVPVISGKQVYVSYRVRSVFFSVNGVKYNLKKHV